MSAAKHSNLQQLPFEGLSAQPLRTSSRISRVGVSPILALSQRARELRAQGIDIIDLTVGEPDFDTPEHIKAAGKAAIDNGRTKYTALTGAADLAAAVVRRMGSRGLEIRQNQVIASTGSKQVINNALQATLDIGDEVILLAPYWTSYVDMVGASEGDPIAVPGLWDAGSGWRIDAQAVEAAITPRTRWLILNSPNNPTGSAATKAELAELAAVLLRHPQVWLLCDDIYEDLVFGAPPPPLLVSHPALAARTLLVGGASKAYAMTGWRIGWGVGPPELIVAMSVVQSQATSAPCSISQAAAVEALLGPQAEVARMRDAFKARRDLMVGRLNEIPSLKCPTPDGAFYVFPNIEDLLGGRGPDGRTLASDSDLSAYLLEQAQVAAVPGSVFGAPGHLRLSFAASQEQLEEACARLAKAVDLIENSPGARAVGPDAPREEFR